MTDPVSAEIAEAQQSLGDSWMARAACRGQDTELFYIDRSTSHGKVCGGCPVRAECLVAGLRDEFGVWGGSTPAQRRRIVHRLRARHLSVSDILQRG
jgi:predicted Fe-S protein YdhL (DUF1289 family)